MSLDTSGPFAVMALAHGPAFGVHLVYSYGLLPAVPEYLIGDGLRLRQVLVNLVNNAVKCTELGEIALTVKRSAAEEPAPRVALAFAVRDTGVGILPEQQAQLLQSFVQGDASTSRKYGGTGLGLAVSPRLVPLMGGRIGGREHRQAGRSRCYVGLRPGRAPGEPAGHAPAL